jgi:hypothetical protein
MDLNVSAFRIAQTLTTDDEKQRKRVAAARIGGEVGGKARASKLSPEQRKEIAVKANEARWRKPA